MTTPCWTKCSSKAAAIASSQSQKLLHDSLFELYMQGGLELYLAAAHSMKRELIIDLETSALTPEKGEIIHFYAVNPWDESDMFDEWAKPLIPLSKAAELVLGVTNEQLSNCRPTVTVMSDFALFLEGDPETSCNYRNNFIEITNIL